MLQNIIFDMGNVLLTFDPEVPLARFCHSEEAKDLIRKELFQGPEWIMGDQGILRNDERYEPVSHRIPSVYHKELADCVSHWDICMKPVPGALSFCQTCKDKGYHIYVLSNADNTFHDYFQRFAQESWFDGVIVSSDVHMIKPEPAIYRHLLQTFSLHPEECFFIDDRPENVKAAVSLGMQGFVFQNDFTPLRKLLF